MNSAEYLRESKKIQARDGRERRHKRAEAQPERGHDGDGERGARAHRDVDALGHDMGEALGRRFSERAFSPEAMAPITGIAPEVVREVLGAAGLATTDLKLLVAHQANLRIAEMVQRSLELRDDQVHNNIQKFGNTTAASIPICLAEGIEAKGVQRGDLVALCAFGAGFTWAGALLRW